MSDEFGSAVDGALEHAAVDAAAGLSREPGRPDGETCLNCGAALTGDFCQECGQSAGSIRRPFWTLIGESLETFFSLDGRIAHTLPDLLLKPGRMTRAYLDGQRARFIPPFRLYVFASLLFFVLMPLATGQGYSFLEGDVQTIPDARVEVEQAFERGEMTEEEYQQAIAGLDQVEEMWRGGVPGLVPDGTDAPETPGDAPETPSTPPDEEWAGFMPESALDAIRTAGENGNVEAERFAKTMEDPNRLAEKTREWIPRMMFVLLPVYALLLAMLYFWRRQFLFFDHLIVSLHFHSALFFAMSLGMVAAMAIGYGWVTLLLIGYSNWYLYRLNRVVYGRGAVSSVLRTLTLDSIYFCVLLSALLSAAILGAISP